MSMSKQTKRQSMASLGCFYCGKTLTLGELHVDHLIPLCLFTSPRPNNLTELPACYTCNNAKSKYDSFLRDLAVLTPGALDHPVARRLRNTKVKRSIEKNKSELFNQLIKSSEFQYTLEMRDTLTGAEFRDKVKGTVDLNGEYARNAILWLIRGIYAASFRLIFPVNTKIMLNHIEKENIEKTKDGIKQVMINKNIDISNLTEMNIDNIFKCMIIYGQNKILFLLTFFDSIAFFVQAFCSPFVLIPNHGVQSYPEFPLYIKSSGISIQ